ncbi:DUF1800 domain-containing protein [Spirosoma radiotolerans]|uniref:Uncharacterized protein n=1 Tax=Spirosoma radiotolerans TaxID=1379870 RepID=A0A0E3ZYB2_9BACT|nr:DUF1800 domain-containing protein [Spirosoma radiotolerans]AKD56715.1 hypothetical protein SD10_19235 [Spirosoma radiotolerans]
MALLDAYTTPLTTAQVGHLLRRATFGPTPEQLKTLTGQTAAQIVTTLLADQPTPAPPLDLTTSKTFHDQPFDMANAGKLSAYVKMWWANLMLNQPVSVLEKMTLFWSNHFVTNTTTVNDYRYMYRYNALLRQFALGNFKAFAVAITQDPAMLRFLNGNQNLVGTANENYARELQELFTIGRNGGYTEDDVKAAARVLTGWVDAGYRDATNATISSSFKASRHDTTDKTFSATYQNTVIKGRSGATAGLDELNDLLDMILKNVETPRYICRKLYRWFINADIPATVETNFIQPLADLFRKNNFDIKPVMSAILQSQHFFDDALRGAIIKSPTDLVIGTFRFWGLQAPAPTQNITGFYQIGNYIHARLVEEQQDLLNPPTVFGWTAYYQTGYYQQWINSTTLGLRGYFGDSLTTNALKLNGRPVIDVLAYAKTLSNPSDAAKLVNDLTTQLLALSLDQTQKDFLTDTILLNTIPRYEWTSEWNDYISAPADTAKKQAVQLKLTAFLQYIFRMAEYQVN